MVSSRSSSASSVQNVDRRIAATDDAIVATEGSTVESADPEVIEAALSQAFDFGEAVAGGADNLVREAFALVKDSQDTIGEVLERESDEGLQGFNNLLKAGVAIAAVAGVAAVMRKG